MIGIPKPPKRTRAPSRLKRTQMKRARTRIAPRKRRFDAKATGLRRVDLCKAQGGDETGGPCAWDGAWWPLTGGVMERLHESHGIALGLGRSRHDQANPINAADNCVLLCPVHHRALDKLAKDAKRARFAELKRNADYLAGAGTGTGASRTGGVR